MTNYSTKRMINNSKSSSKTYLYLNTNSNTKDAYYNFKRNLNFTEEKKSKIKNQHRINSSKKFIRSNKFSNGLLMKGHTPKNLKALNFFQINYNLNSNNNDKKKVKINNFKINELSKDKKVYFSDQNKNKKIPTRNGLNLAKIENNNLIEKLNKKRNDDFLQNLKNQKKGNKEYNNIIYNIFKRTEVF